MDFRERLLTSDLRHVSDTLKDLSEEFLIIQDFIKHEFGDKLAAFMTTRRTKVTSSHISKPTIKSRSNSTKRHPMQAISKPKKRKSERISGYGKNNDLKRKSSSSRRDSEDIDQTVYNALSDEDYNYDNSVSVANSGGNNSGASEASEGPDISGMENDDDYTSDNHVHDLEESNINEVVFEVHEECNKTDKRIQVEPEVHNNQEQLLKICSYLSTTGTVKVENESAANAELAKIVERFTSQDSFRSAWEFPSRERAEDIKAIIRRTSKGKLSKTTTAQKMRKTCRLVVIGGVDWIMTQENKPILPQDLFPQEFRKAHDDKGHQGRAATMNFMRQHWYCVPSRLINACIDQCQDQICVARMAKKIQTATKYYEKGGNPADIVQ